MNFIHSPWAVKHRPRCTCLTLLGILWFVCPIASVRAKKQGSSIWKQVTKGCYEEHLEVHRMPLGGYKKQASSSPQMPDQISLDQTSMLDQLLAKRKMAYECFGLFKGYTIQVYMGSSRKAALQAQEKAILFQSMYVPELHYRQPNYMVRLGFFSNKLEAYTVYVVCATKMLGVMIRPYTIARALYLKDLLGEVPTNLGIANLE